MITPALLAWWNLQILNKDRYTALMDVYGNLDDALASINPEMLGALGCRGDTVERILVQLEEFNAEAYAKEMDKQEVELLDLLHDAYPTRLREIGDPPVFLSYKGDLSLLDQPTIGLVGTRAMTAYGKRVTEYFTPAFVQAGMVTVSGLALGIDATVAEATIAAGGKTVAVLGNGLGSIYPKSHARLAEQILAHGGLLLSEFPLGMQPDKYTFPARNRIIAGLSIGTVVFEAPVGSGAIITAELALEYGREVFAVPGQVFDPNAAGCHALIAGGRAHMAQTPEGVLKELGIVASERGDSAPIQFSDPTEEEVFGLLTSMPQSLDDLVQKSALEAGAINASLTMMELSGYVKNVGGGLWVRR